jgi:haloalkane dehalogenase
LPEGIFLELDAIEIDRWARSDGIRNRIEPLIVVVEAAQRGSYADEFVHQWTDKAFARSAHGIGGICYADPTTLTDDAINCYFGPLVGTLGRRAQLNRCISSFLRNPLPSIESSLAAYPGSVRIPWGTADPIFDPSWAKWLHRTFPGSTGVRWIERARLFFPEEAPDVVAHEVLRLWGESR